MPGLGNLTRLPSDKEDVYRSLEAALSGLQTWMHDHNAAEGRADAAGLAETLRVLWQALKAAGAEGTLRSWHSGKGLGGWEGPSWEGQLLETGSYVEGVMNGDHAAENSAEIAEVQEGMVRRFLNTFTYDTPKWIDFRRAVDEYAKELLDALRPAGLDDDGAVLEALRAAIRATTNGRTAKSAIILRKSGVRRAEGIAGLRKLQEAREYSGFIRSKRRKRTP